MKKFFAITLVALLTATISTSVFADELTLDDCIESALKTRASILAARGGEEVASAGEWSALGAFLPQISGSYNYSKGEVIYPGLTQTTGPSKRWGASAGMTIIDVASVYNYAASRAAHAKAKLNVLASEQNLIYVVKVSYYAYLANVQNVSTQEEAVKRAEEQLKLIESRYELGSAAKSDVLKQKVQHGNDRLALLRAENAVINAKANLAYTVGLDPRLEHEFSTAYNVREYDGSLDEAIGFGVQRNPGLLAMQKNVDLAKHSLRSTWASYLPTLSVNGSWFKFKGTERSFTDVQEFSYQSKNWGYSINLNIFDGFFRERRLASARVAHNNARAEEADGRNQTVSDIKVAYLEIELLKEQRTVSTENVAAAEEDLKITQEKYALGAATILDLLDAQVSDKRAQVSLINVDFDLNLAIAKLEKAMGKM